MSIEQDLARIATALEQVASLMKVPPQFILEMDKPTRREDVDLFMKMLPEEEVAANTPQPAEFVKPGPGPGRGHKKKKDDVQKMDTTENPTPAESSVEPAEVPDTAPVIEDSPASPSEPAAEEPVKPAVPEVTLDDVRVALVTMSKTKSRDDVLEICKRFGATSGRDIPPEHYFDALMAFKEGARA